MAGSDRRFCALGQYESNGEAAWAANVDVGQEALRASGHSHKLVQ